MERFITTEEIVQAAIDSAKAATYYRMPGSVVAYYPATQTADVQPMVNDVRLDLVTGAVVFEPWSVIYGVPVAWHRAGGCFSAGCLVQFDQVTLEAFDLDPTPWRAQGRSNKPVNPADVRRQGGNYWSATPADLTTSIQNAPTSKGWVLGIDGSQEQLIIQPGLIQAGASGTDFVALGTPTNAMLSALSSFATTAAAAGTVGQIAAAASTMKTALQAITSLPSTLFKAK